MILVTVGTNEARFDRLLHAVDELPEGEELIVQHGPSPVRSHGATCVDYLPFDELVATVSACRVVVTHAGVGSIMAALVHGKRPVVMPRLARFKEAVDDHQVPLAHRLHRAGFVVCVEDAEQLAAAVSTSADAGVAPPREPADSRLSADLRGYLQDRLGRGTVHQSIGSNYSR
jgi:UDP-N-acetylglucosamine transferase subunit ALG13